MDTSQRTLRAAMLKKIYEVNGYFYDVKLANGNILHMRNILEIRNKKNKSTGIDAVVIMMNPGKSKPIKKRKIDLFTQGNVCEELKSRFNSKNSTIPLYKTKPDVTQYQIMRVMERQGWNYVRVINLSDVREPKSKKFEKKLKDELQNFNEHSLFSKGRIQELAMLMGETPNVPAIFAWGVSTALSTLGKQCIDCLPDISVIGKKKPTKEYLYYHPLQRGSEAQKEWVDSICSQIEKNL